MKVRELINILKMHDPEMMVCLFFPEDERTNQHYSEIYPEDIQKLDVFLNINQGMKTVLVITKE